MRGCVWQVCVVVMCVGLKNSISCIRRRHYQGRESTYSIHVQVPTSVHKVFSLNKHVRRCKMVRDKRHLQIVVVLSLARTALTNEYIDGEDEKVG